MYKYFKRILDVSFALIAITMLSPLLLFIAICIKIESKGPVIFVQQRSGIRGILFNIYKFRSMRINTPDVATDKLVDSSKYITRVGRVIRKTSLDELPQLINLLKGEMSLVGPRPALYNQYELIEARRQRGIHHLKPGITGYAQVKGRDFISDVQKVIYDEYYFNHLSFLLDMKILFLTFIKVVRTENVRG